MMLIDPSGIAVAIIEKERGYYRLELFKPDRTRRTEISEDLDYLCCLVKEHWPRSYEFKK